MNETTSTRAAASRSAISPAREHTGELSSLQTHLRLRPLPAMISTDANGCVAELNSLAESLTGWSEAAAQGRPLGEICKERSIIFDFVEPRVAPPLQILTVDDNRGSARMLAVLLRRLGNCVVETFHDGPSVLARLQEATADVVFLDIGLPGMDGHEIARLIRGMQLTDLLLVALTGFGQEEDFRRSIEAGFDHHLTKPPTLAELKNILCEAESRAASRSPHGVARNSQSDKLDRRDSDRDDGQSQNAGESSVAAATTAPELDGRKVRHDVGNTVHVLKLVVQLLSAGNLDEEHLQAVREGLQTEVQRLEWITAARDAAAEADSSAVQS